MLLAVDVGNTETVVGLYGDAELLDHWRIATNAERTGDEHAMLLSQFLSQHGMTFEKVTGIAVSSTVPRLTATMQRMATRYLSVPTVILGPGVKTGMPILYEDPKEVGPDRIANAVAAYDLYGGPTIVVDFGTATTFDAISSRGEYLGGAIAPGLAISAEALFQRAARLPRVDIRRPPHVIGRNTTHSVQSGLFHGYVSLVSGILSRMREEVGEPARTIGTGGLLVPLEAELRALLDTLDPDLTLEGLRIIYDRNR